MTERVAADTKGGVPIRIDRVAKIFGADTDNPFRALKEVSVDIEPGKTLITKFLTVGDPHPDGTRQVFFELNGQPREVLVMDRSLAAEGLVHPKAEPNNPLHVAAPMPGLIVRVTVAAGDQVEKEQKLFTLEAMKMETTVYAERAGMVAEVLVQRGTQVEAGDLLLRFAGDK